MKLKKEGENNMEETEKDLRLFRIWLKAGKTVYNRIIEDLKRYGLTADNFSVLELLYNKGPQHVQPMCDKLMIPSGSITYVVNKLEGKGLVRKVQDEDNRRYWKVSLTEEGEALFDEIFPQHVETIQEILNPLAEQQKEELGRLLKIVGLNAYEE